MDIHYQISYFRLTLISIQTNAIIDSNRKSQREANERMSGYVLERRRLASLAEEGESKDFNRTRK